MVTRLIHSRLTMQCCIEFSKVFTDMDDYVYAKQRKATQEDQAVYSNILKFFLCTDHMARQAAEQKESCKTPTMMVRKLWPWDEYVVLCKEDQHAIMESITDYGYSEMENCIKICYFLQGNK